MNEQFGECLPKLARHAAVYGKINGIRKNNEEVGDENDGIQCIVLNQLNGKGILNYVQNGDYGEGNFQQEEHGHYDN